MNITFLLNQIPLRAGEVARSLLATRSGVPVVTAATSIIVERLLDTVLVVVLLAAALSRLPNAPPTATQAAALFGVVSVVAFVVLVFFARYQEFAHRVVKFIEQRIPLAARLGLGRMLEHVLDGLKPLTDWRIAVHAVVWTLIAWTFSLLTVYSLERALAIEGVDLLLGAVLAVTLASFSIAIPVTVASIGAFEGAVRIAGDAVGIASDVAISLGFLFHGITVLGYAFWGVIGLLAMGVSLGDLLKAREAAPQEAANNTAAETPSRYP